jgi:hypothetical protein
VPQGTTGLKSIIEYYQKNYNRYTKYGLGNNNPIIIVIDNDEGASAIKNLIKIEDDKYFKLVRGKLYVLLVTKEDGKAIESLFDQEILDTKIDGKSFKPSSKKNDSDNSYGKQIFATKVVKAQQNKINFDKFKSIFDNINKIIEDSPESTTPIKL